MSIEVLLRKTLISVEKVFITLGVWPSSWNWWVTIANIIVLTFFSFLVILKTFVDPESKSIENAITLANGDIATVAYYVTLLLKWEECKQLYEFVKKEQKLASTAEENEIVINSAKEFLRISRAFLYFVSSASLVRFLIPTAELIYVKVLI